MSQQRHFANGYSNTARKIITPVLIALLLLLTTINYFIYSTDNCGCKSQVCSTDYPIDNSDTADNTNPAGPDEKAPNSPSSFSDEYVHEAEELSALHFTLLDREHPSYIDKLPLVHFKIFSPPPEC